MFEHIHHVHLIGANGVGVSAVGKLFLHWGAKVSGSDLHRGIFFDELRELGASLDLSHERSHLPKDVDLVVYSSAVPESNPERQAAKERGVTEWSFAEFLGQLATDYTTIAVTGTHGKSTTTAMIGKILEAAGLDPTVIVGSRVPGWPLGNLRVGSLEFSAEGGSASGGGVRSARCSQPTTYNLQPTNYLVLEACEHMAHHLKIKPDIGVITNIEFDHPDFYRDVLHVAETMREWSLKIPTLVVNANDLRSASLITQRTKGHDRAFLFADVLDLQLKVPGEYNRANAAAALAVARVLEIDEAVARKALETFSGIWRRFERLGEWNGAEVISDYGHHPTAIRETLKAARELFPSRRLVHIFQPHQHARTAELFDAFVSVLGEADVTILVEIYGVAGRTEAETVSAKDLVAAVKNRRPAHRSSTRPSVASKKRRGKSEGGSGSFVRYAKDLDEADELVREIAKPGDVLFFQGAGDIDDVARRLVS